MHLQYIDIVFLLKIASLYISGPGSGPGSGSFFVNQLAQVVKFKQITYRTSSKF